MKKFMLNAALGIGILLGCMAFGFYIIGPRLEFTPEGKPRFHLSREKLEEEGAYPQRVALPPKVEVYEKLPSSTTNSGGDTYSTERQVAPYDYSDQDKKADKPKRKPDKTTSSTEPTTEQSDETAALYAEPSIETPALEPETPVQEPDSPPALKPPAKPDPGKEKPAEQPKSSNTSYRVQVGIYQNRENANQVVQTLRASGFQAAIIPFQQDGSTVYRVQVGVYKNKETADTVAKSLREKGFEAYVSGGN